VEVINGFRVKAARSRSVPFGHDSIPCLHLLVSRKCAINLKRVLLEHRIPESISEWDLVRTPKALGCSLCHRNRRSDSYYLVVNCKPPLQIWIDVYPRVENLVEFRTTSAIAEHLPKGYIYHIIPEEPDARASHIHNGLNLIEMHQVVVLLAELPNIRESQRSQNVVSATFLHFWAWHCCCRWNLGRPEVTVN